MKKKLLKAFPAMAMTICILFSLCIGAFALDDETISITQSGNYRSGISEHDEAYDGYSKANIRHNTSKHTVRIDMETSSGYPDDICNVRANIRLWGEGYTELINGEAGLSGESDQSYVGDVTFNQSNQGFFTLYNTVSGEGAWSAKTQYIWDEDSKFGGKTISVGMYNPRSSIGG